MGPPQRPAFPPASAAHPPARPPAQQVIDCLDVRKAESTVESDRIYILNLAERQLGLDTFNAKLRSALQHEICEAMILRCAWRGCLGRTGVGGRSMNVYLSVSRMYAHL